MTPHADLPDPQRWDGRATPDQVRHWLESLREDPYGPHYHLLTDLIDEAAAPVLRDYLEDENPRVCEPAVRAIGVCGTAEEDGPRLLAMAESSLQPSEVLLDTLTELEVPGTVDLLRSLLSRTTRGSGEEATLLDRLVWLRDRSIAERLMELVRDRGLDWFGPLAPAKAVFRIGDAAERAELAAHAVAAGIGFVTTHPHENPELYTRFMRDWHAYESVAREANVPELSDVYARVSAAPQVIAAGRTTQLRPLAEYPVAEYADCVVPSLWLRRTDTPAEDTWPPPKFLGQPDWRDGPAWPVTPSGVPLMFYGQLPLPGAVESTAYIFLDGADEWQPLGVGNAVVVQPGNLCHLDTIPLREGPQADTWDPHRYPRRHRKAPHPEVFVELVPSNDPVEWTSPLNLVGEDYPRDNPRHLNKIGGTPSWLQGEWSPGEGWAFIAQFEASRLAIERGDGAVCYLWRHADGHVAFGWQCS